MIDSLKFNIGDMVYHRTEDQPGVVIGVMYRPGTMLYQVMWQGRMVEDHYECELTSERPFFSSCSRDEEEA